VNLWVEIAYKSNSRHKKEAPAVGAYCPVQVLPDEGATQLFRARPHPPVSNYSTFCRKTRILWYKIAHKSKLKAQK